MSTIQLRGDGSCVEVHPDGTVTALPIAGLVAPSIQAAAKTVEAEASAFATRATKAAKPTKRTTRSIVAELRARLKEVEREIKVRESLEAERSQIKRLIDAATGKTPAAPVRPIARTG